MRDDRGDAGGRPDADRGDARAAGDAGADATTSRRCRRGAAPVFSPALELMRGVVRRASAAIFEAAWPKPELRGMGTTLTAVLVHGGPAHVVHAGDSRCYMFRDGQLRQLTDDHSWIAEQLQRRLDQRGRGEDEQVPPRDHEVDRLRARHRGRSRRPCRCRPGDCFLLCRDGMSNYVEHGELERIVAMTWYRRLPQTLIELANNRGGDDNITVVVGLVANAPPGE